MSGAQNGSAYSNLTETLAGNGRPESYPASNNFALFVQDDFRVNDQLTVNLGLRYQFIGPVKFAAAHQDPAPVTLDQRTPAVAADFVGDERA